MTLLKTLDNTVPSSLCFGAMQFGGLANAAASSEMYDACRTAGVNFFDTAHVYNGGASEELLAKFIKAEREKLLIATKVAYTGGSGRQNIEQQFDQSRARLGLDTVDILYLHRWDSDTPLTETFETLRDLQLAGRIRYIGVSNFAAWQVMKAQAVAQRFGTQINIIQPMYSLVKRQAEVELLPMALSEGMAVAAYSPLGAGLLTGKYQMGATGRLSSDARYAKRYGQAWMAKTAMKLSRFAKTLDVDPATLAVAWAAKHPGVTAPIISARNASQLAASLNAISFELSTEHYNQIEAFSQRPAPATDRLEEA